MILIPATLLVYTIRHYWWPFHLMISCTLYVVVVDDGYFSVGRDDACTEEHQHHRCLLKDTTNKPKKYGV